FTSLALMVVADQFIRDVGRGDRMRAATSAFVKGFGCRPHDGGAARTGPASESLQGRKPRLRERRPCRRCYGDLRAAGEICDRDRAAPASWPTVKRLVNRRRIASDMMNCRTI